MASSSNTGSFTRLSGAVPTSSPAAASYAGLAGDGRRDAGPEVVDSGFGIPGDASLPHATVSFGTSCSVDGGCRGGMAPGSITEDMVEGETRSQRVIRSGSAVTLHFARQSFAGPLSSPGRGARSRCCRSRHVSVPLFRLWPRAHRPLSASGSPSPRHALPARPSAVCGGRCYPVRKASLERPAVTNDSRGPQRQPLPRTPGQVRVAQVVFWRKSQQ